MEHIISRDALLHVLGGVVEEGFEGVLVSMGGAPTAFEHSLNAHAQPGVVFTTVFTVKFSFHAKSFHGLSHPDPNDNWVDGLFNAAEVQEA